MPNEQIMETVVAQLQGFGLQVTTPQEDVDLPYRAALVDFGTDDEDRPVVLQVLHYSHDILSQLEEIEEPDIPLSILSFLMTVPVEIPDKKSAEVLRLISLANKSLPLGALNYSEAEKGVYYSYSIPTAQTAPSETILATILHTSIFVKETFFMAVDLVSQGKESVDTILQEGDKTMQKVKKK